MFLNGARIARCLSLEAANLPLEWEIEVSPGGPL